MITALSAALFHFLWQGVALALIPTLALMFRSPRVRYGAACVALFAMPVVFAVTFAMSIPTPAESIALASQPHSFTGFVAEGMPALPRPLNLEQSMRWFIPFWIAGVLLFWLRMTLSWIAVRRLRHASSCAAPAQWTRRVNELAVRLGIRRVVGIVESTLVDVPVVAGFLRPVIFVPAALFIGMPTEQLEYLLIHELAHIRRFDYAVNLLQKAVEGLLFYHPAMWWVSRILRTERENCCDDAVVAMSGKPREYASVLALLEQNRMASAMAASGGHLKQRVLRLLNRPGGFNPAPMAGLMLIAVSATVAWAALQEPAALQLPMPALPSVPVRALMAMAAPQTPVPAAPAAQSKPERLDTLKDEMRAPFKKWLKEDVAYIITQEERKAFANLTTDEEREMFVEQFWLRRDPTPGTPANEFKEEYYRRIAYTNAHFTDNAGVPGWQTDRGRIYITYGPPDEIDSHPADTVPHEMWRYRYIEGIGNDVLIEFQDPNHTGTYRMTSDPSEPLAGVNIVPTARGIILSVPLDLNADFNIFARITLNGKSVAAAQDVIRHKATMELPFTLAPAVYRLNLTVRNASAPGGTRSFSTDFTVR